MNRTHTVPVALALTLSLAAASAPAAAQADANPGGMSIMFAVGLATAAVGGAVVVTGLVSDIGITVDLARTGHASRGFAVAGTAVWTAMTLIDVLGVYGGPDPLAALSQPENLAITALCVGSLVYSIYGMAHPPPLAVAPTAFVTPDGHAAAGLVVAGRF